MSEPIITFDKVNKWYGNSFHVLRDIDLTVTKGERIVVCGPSGSGKTVLLTFLLAQAERLISELRASLPALAGQTIAGQTIAWADDLAYTDPVDGSRSERQGVRVIAQPAEVTWLGDGDGWAWVRVGLDLKQAARRRLAALHTAS